MNESQEKINTIKFNIRLDYLVLDNFDVTGRDVNMHQLRSNVVSRLLNIKVSSVLASYQHFVGQNYNQLVAIYDNDQALIVRAVRDILVKMGVEVCDE